MSTIANRIGGDSGNGGGGAVIAQLWHGKTGADK